MKLWFFIFWFVFIFSVFAEAQAGVNNTSWDCEQTAGGEWTCQNQDNSGNDSAKPEVNKTVKPQPDAAKSSTTVNPPTSQSPQPTAKTINPDKSQPNVSEQVATPNAKSVTVPTTVAAPITATPTSTTKEPIAADKTLVVETVAEKPKIPVFKPKVHINENQKPKLQQVEPVREQVANTEGQVPGWTCQSTTEKSNWNCNLVGPDPKGEEQPIPEVSDSGYWFTPTFNRSQELTFQRLREEFSRDPWQDCENWSTKKRKHFSISKESRESADTDVTADFSEAFEGEVLNFAGNVDLRRADQHLLADKASYDTAVGTMDAQGNITYSEAAFALAGDSMSLNMNTDEAKLRNTLFIAGDGPLRGRANVIYRDSKILSRYHDTAFTSCSPGNQDWIIRASRLKINRETGKGSAKDAWLEFKNVPVVYTPYISFPTDQRRLSGFLSPTWGSTQRSGFYAAAPFYWNIAPNLDTTITPSYFSGRGEMLGNKLRYLTETSRGTLNLSYMPFDQKLDKSRYAFSYKDKSVFSPRWNSNVDLNLVSDHTYFNDLNNVLGVQRNSYLNSIANINYGGGGTGLGFSSSIQHYQSVDPTIGSKNPLMPYDVLPKVNLTYNHTFDSMPLKVSMQSQYSNFYHQTLVNGQRMVFWPSISAPFESSAGFFIPKVSVQSVQYQLSNQSATGLPASINRTLPIFSVDTGLAFEKPMEFGDGQYNNIIEPRLFYLYIPRKNQTDIPLFDTTAYDPNFSSLFRENSYTGYDRLQDANQVTLATTSRYVDSVTGLEPLKVSVGEIFYMQNRDVTLTSAYQLSPQYTVPVQASKTSNLVGEVSGQIDQHLSYLTGAQWNSEDNRFARGQAVLKYRNQPDQIFDIGYRYRSSVANPLVPQTVIPGSLNLPATISLADASFRWPLLNDWFVLGRWQYSLNFDKTLESFIGIEKENCCWRLRFIGRRYINGATTSNYTNLTPETGFFVQIELKGLSGFGDNVDIFLQNNLNGYHKSGYFD